MLVWFKAENFKNFKEEIELKLDNIKGYEFNLDGIKDDVVKTCLVYGKNGSGKSNLCLALFDITLHLTDKEKNLSHYRNYLNLENNGVAKFYYKFKFRSSYLVYEYEKNGPQQIIKEALYIDDEMVAFYDHKKQEGETKLEGTETLNKNLYEKNMSFIKYISSNTVLPDNKINNVLKEFIRFVDNMLLFSSLEKNHYQGFKIGMGSIAKEIIERGKLKDFETFLRDVGIDYKLVEREVEGESAIYCDFNGREVNFFSIASRGTCSLTLFYAWLIYINETSLVVIDEFDAFYHNTLAKVVVKELLKGNNQTILTTHNTGIMNNELLRPDCYFNIENGRINPFSDLTNKDLRKAHNIEKMYRAGSFDE